MKNMLLKTMLACALVFSTHVQATIGSSVRFSSMSTPHFPTVNHTARYTPRTTPAPSKGVVRKPLVYMHLYQNVPINLLYPCTNILISHECGISRRYKAMPEKQDYREPLVFAKEKQINS